jgi:hypothetical protein
MLPREVLRYVAISCPHAVHYYPLMFKALTLYSTPQRQSPHRHQVFSGRRWRAVGRKQGSCLLRCGSLVTTFQKSLCRTYFGLKVKHSSLYFGPPLAFDCKFGTNRRTALRLFARFGNLLLIGGVKQRAQDFAAGAHVIYLQTCTVTWRHHDGPKRML